MANSGNHGTAVEAAMLRQFGINETYQLAMYLLDQYRGTTLSCRYEMPKRLAALDSQAQLEEAVKVAVVGIIMRHPMLRVGMTDTTTKTPSWIQLPSLDLTRHIKWLHLTEQDDFEHRMQETFSTQLDDRFPDLTLPQPCWKMTIIRHSNVPTMEVLLTWNHPQFDAMGAKVFHEDLIEMLNANANNIAGEHSQAGFKLDGDILTLPKEAPMLPSPVEVLQSLPVDVKFLLKAFWEDIRPEFLNRDISWAAWCPIRPTPYKTRFRAFFLGQTAVLAIQALCRANKTTVTGLLNGLALIAFASRLDAAAAPAFQCATIVDHRRNLPPAPPGAPWGTYDRAVSNYVTQCFHKWEPALVARIRSELLAVDATGDGGGAGRELSAGLRRELWDASARNRREIVDKLEAGLRNDLVGLFKYVTDWKQTMQNLAKKRRQFTWLVTNIGVLESGGSASPGVNAKSGDGDGQQKWSISRAQFGLSTEVPMAAMEFSPVSVSGHGMCVAATWSDCAVGVTLAEGIMADIERWMVQLST